ncbi:GH92 family glycosyl hydrolase [Mucilaginibacter myungsuensis]|uniref:GH92 family glycosyl hydrolase n=1 Tax=Mucilaginibacter myungsuensis TaxID=649104 RepID=A0A929PVY4_9SPHI|nr:GH92 family glycosyl hydrolase [Mucilaginibacter myungsuensis]MBE9660800.1 GH92 family glycosyl hydrolase [Mucilaginibacter myungsuensis]MDN3600846.1 GH92 family glycosyl hydrolase [Mucilaginibacter myungsuensis]
MKKLIMIAGLLAGGTLPSYSQSTVWSVGKADGSANEFALAPNGYKKFVASDFGYEDKFFLIGHSDLKKDFPYVLPGPADTWGGTWPTSGWRISQQSILFDVKELAANGDYKLVIKLADHAKKFLPLLKVSINGQDEKIQLDAQGYDLAKQPHPRTNEPTIDSAALKGDLSRSTAKTLTININKGIIRKGGNTVSITVLQGSWIMFDEVSLQGNATLATQAGQLFVRDIKPADYELLNNGIRTQPLLINTEHVKGKPTISVELDGKIIFKNAVEKGNYDFEAPMPAVATTKTSRYRILENGKPITEGTVERGKQKLQTLANYVDTRIGTGHSRWMIAPGPWMPFSMVKMSPDNQNPGWQAGYEPSFESVGTFSHIHEWTMGGLGIFASNGKLKANIGDELKPGSGYRSTIDKKTEEAPIGAYKVQLTDYDIKAEVTATTRCGFERFTFPKDRDSARVLVDLHIPAEYDYNLKEIKLKKVSDYRIEGYTHQFSGGIWSNDADQDYHLYFVIEVDKPIKSIGGWINNKLVDGDTYEAKDIRNAGVYLNFDAKQNPVVQVRSGISFVSLANADLNLKTEISTPFGWSFEKIQQNQVNAWNEIFNRVKITSNNRLEKRRFYNAMYRASSRNTFSDVNGQWVGTDGKTQQLAGKDDLALGCDAFWNTFWNLNQVWNLVTPEWSQRWVNSQLAMYKAYGWLAKGPAGMNYVPVMVAEHEIPQMVSAYQMGIRGFDANLVLEAAQKMQTTPAQKVFKGFAGNRDLKQYLKHHYVPSDSGRFSNSMEYSYDDWTVGQLAKSLGKTDVYNKYNDRGYWWKNAIDTAGYSHMKLSNGEWVKNFDPFRSGANEHYVEGNAWQLTFFVPQDVPSLIRMIGKKKFTDRLEWGFSQSEPWRYNGMNDQYWDYPVVQGNQQSMHFAFLFNWAGKPWSTQKWSRSIIERFYGFGVSNAWLGDEDQGQMSAWLVMAALGLFQTDGGTSANPVYEIASPLYQKIEIDLGQRFGRGKKFTIEAKDASRNNMYVQSAMLNGKPLNSFKFRASELLKGGSLILQMGPTPNQKWGIAGSTE